MHNPYNTKGARLKHARDILGLTQGFIAGVLGVKQVGISKRESGETDITYEEAVKLQLHDDIQIRADWLMNGDGDMLVVQQVMSESNVEYKSKLIDTSEAAITKRFVNEVLYRAKQQAMLEKEIANKLNVSPGHWSQLKSGQKLVTTVMLSHASLNLQVDANYVVSNRANAEVLGLREELKRSKEDNENMRELIRELKKGK